MSVRRRRWTTAGGVPKEVWVVDYTDQHGKRHHKTFALKKSADSYHLTVNVELRQGTHTPDSQSILVKEAGLRWLAACDKIGLERATTEEYRRHLERHIVPHLGRFRLSQLTAPLIREFDDTLRNGGLSAAMTKKVVGSLGAILSDAQEQGLVSRNVVRDLRANRRGRERKLERRQKGKLKIGADIPTREEIKLIVHTLTGRWRPLLLTAIFTGLRASELRGLRWADVDLKQSEIRVTQRADRFNKIGKTKSEAGERIVPLVPMLVNTLREWKLACPNGELGLVFPNGQGRIESHSNILKRGFVAVQLKAGVTIPVVGPDGIPIRDEKGRPRVRAKYTGLHSLRHFFASWCINSRAEGGLERPPKLVQSWLGHSSIVMTMDTYGHLFPRGDNAQEFADAERALLG